jgi:hypothetical protein
MAERMDALKKEREGLEPQMRHIKALEQIADALSFLQGQIAGLTAQVSAIAQSLPSKFDKR